MKNNFVNKYLLLLSFAFCAITPALGQTAISNNTVDEDQHYYIPNVEGVGTNSVKYHAVNKISTASVEEINKLF